MTDSSDQTADGNEEPPRPSVGAQLRRIAKIALLLSGVLLAGVGVWAWLSSGSDDHLPFGYEGFD